MKNIINQFKQFILQVNRNKKKYLMVRYIGVFILVFSVFIGIAQASDKSVKPVSNIVFDNSQLFPLRLTDKKVNIELGLASIDMEKLNNERDPEAIKAYIQQLGNEYNVDWKLVYAIGVYESGNFKSSLAINNNNFFGRKATSTTWRSWNTPDEAIRDQFNYVKTRYIDQGLDTPAKMNYIYCEGNTWQNKIQFIMDSV